jgi:hypothetical protein
VTAHALHATAERGDRTRPLLVVARRGGHRETAARLALGRTGCRLALGRRGTTAAAGAAAPGAAVLVVAGRPGAARTDIAAGRSRDRGCGGAEIVAAARKTGRRAPIAEAAGTSTRTARAPVAEAAGRGSALAERSTALARRTALSGRTCRPGGPPVPEACAAFARRTALAERRTTLARGPALAEAITRAALAAVREAGTGRRGIAAGRLALLAQTTFCLVLATTTRLLLAAVTLVLLALARLGGQALGLAARFLRGAASRFLGGALAVVGLANAGICESTGARILFLIGKGAQNHSGGWPRRTRGSLRLRREGLPSRRSGLGRTRSRALAGSPRRCSARSGRSGRSRRRRRRGG